MLIQAGKSPTEKLVLKWTMRDPTLEEVCAVFMKLKLHAALNIVKVYCKSKFILLPHYSSMNRLCLN